MRYFEDKPAFTVATKSGRPAIAIICKKCEKHFVGSDKITCPPEVIIKHFLDLGWQVIGNGSSAICPDCRKKNQADRAIDESVIAADLERQRQAEVRRQMTAAPQPIAGHPTVRRREAPVLPKLDQTPQTPEAPPVPLITDEESEEAIIARSRVDDLLREHCERQMADGAKRAKYDDGWSDERIHRETGMAVPKIRRIREAVYGKLEDPRLASLEAEIERIRSRFETEIKAAEGEIGALKDQMTTTLAKLGRDVAEIRARS